MELLKQKKKPPPAPKGTPIIIVVEWKTQS